ncbi:ABC transporter ATP-binding protein [Schaalia sp. 19OD2882]|nr:ABC transporter ATP-binding protein [Schaalia sp. 19OD2882]
MEVSGLVKRFGKVAALDGLDLAVSPGQVHGFLGPNGAGKSTTIRVLLGMHRADAGRVRVLGKEPWTHASAVNTDVASVAGDVALWPSLTGGQVLDTLAGLRGRRDRAREDELIQRFDLDPSKRIRTYSKGNRQKVALVAALAAPVELLVLDEPTAGLDPLMERVFQEVVHELTACGTTILLSSHILAEVQRLCSAVTIVKDGRTVESGDLARLRALSRTRVRLGGAAEVLRLVSDEAAARGLPADQDEGALRFEVDPAQVPTVLELVVAHGLGDVLVEPATLEDLFLQHYSADSASARSQNPLSSSSLGAASPDPASSPVPASTPTPEARHARR